jgi:hypothetical protein
MSEFATFTCLLRPSIVHIGLLVGSSLATSLIQNPQPSSSLNLMAFADHILSGARAQATGGLSKKARPILPLSEPRRQSSHDEQLQAVAVEGESPKPAGERTATKDESNHQQQSALEPAPIDRPLPHGKPPILIRMKRGSGRFWGHTKNALTHSYINVLLVFVPIGIVAKYAHLNAAIVFAMNAIAIIPLAGLLTHATESVAMRLGDTVGALLNVSFGNAVELIILYVSSLAGQELTC